MIRACIKGDHPKVEIEVEFYDSAAGELVLEYDAVGSAAPKTKNVKMQRGHGLAARKVHPG